MGFFLQLVHAKQADNETMTEGATSSDREEEKIKGYPDGWSDFGN